MALFFISWRLAKLRAEEAAQGGLPISCRPLCHYEGLLHLHLIDISSTVPHTQRCELMVRFRH